MVDAAPFPALRYNAAVAGDPGSTSAPAYDELERFAYARHRTASPYTVLELLAPSASQGGTAAYRKAGATYERWRRTGVLTTDARPAFYLYEEHELRHGVPALQRGLLAAVRVGGDDLRAHEAVDPARVSDRLERLRAVPADLSPLFGVYLRAPDELRQLLGRPAGARPTLAFTDETGIDHRVWTLDDPVRVEAIREGLAAVDVVIADGHHRYGAALALRQLRPDAERTLAYLVDAEVHGPQILPVHRLVHDLPADAEQRLARDFHLEQAPADAVQLPSRLATVPGRVYGLLLPGGRALLLAARNEDALQARLPAGRADVWRELDTVVLEHAVLPRLGAAAIEYRSDLTAAAEEVGASRADALFVLRPVDAATVHACAAAGQAMPAKTTWFRPKPRAGLIMRSLDS